MNAILKKTLVTGLVSLTALTALATAPALAWHPHHPYYGGGFGWGAAGLVTGLAIGTMAATAAPVYECGTVRQPVYNEYGRFVGYRYVPAC